MKIVSATLFVLIVVAISWAWFWTIPQCLASSSGTPGYAATARSVSDDEGVFGCWWAGLTPSAGASTTSKNGRAKASASNVSAAPDEPAKWFRGLPGSFAGTRFESASLYLFDDSVVIGVAKERDRITHLTRDVAH